MHKITGTHIENDIPSYPKIDWVYLSICVVLAGGLRPRTDASRSFMQGPSEVRRPAAAGRPPDAGINELGSSPVSGWVGELILGYP